MLAGDKKGDKRERRRKDKREKVERRRRVKWLEEQVALQGCGSGARDAA